MAASDNKELPAGWFRRTLGEVADYLNGRAFKSTEWEPSGLPIIRIQNLNNPNASFNYTSQNYEERYRVENGDLLFAWSASLGAYIWREGSAWLNQHIFRVDPKPFVDRSFLFYFLDNVVAELYVQAHGSGMVHITKKKFNAIPVLLPPLGEQRRIVAKIEELFSELDKGVESLKAARAQLKIYRQSLLKAAFEGRLTEQWRRDNAGKLETADQLLLRIRGEREVHYKRQLEEWKAAVRKWKQSGSLGRAPRKPASQKPLPEIEVDELSVLPRIPKAWRYARLAVVATVGSGMSVSKSRKLADPIEVPYLRVANVQRGRLVLDEIKTMRVEKTALDGLRLEEWDILFNEGGDRDKLGRGWVWEGKIAPCITQNHVFRATTYLGDEFHAKFISYWGNVYGRDYFEKVGKQTTNLASINKTVLKMFPVPVPPYDEQREIVRRLEKAEREVIELEKQFDDGLIRSGALRQSILKRAFEGKLVPQDPNDEPASVLLERIRQEQADQPRKTRGKRKAEASV